MEALPAEGPTKTDCDAGVAKYRAEPTATLAAATVYLPVTSWERVWVPETDRLKPSGPEIVTAADDPAGSPKTEIERFPVLRPLGPPSQARAANKMREKSGFRESSGTIESFGRRWP